MLLSLTTEDAVWKALPSERRNRVRKGEKNGPDGELGAAPRRSTTSTASSP